MPLARQTLIHDRWPDKALFASVLLLVAGALGVLHGFVAAIDGIAFTSRLLGFVETYPPWATVGFSLLSVLGAVLALRTRDLRWAFLGVLGAVLSFGLILVEPFLGIVALYFLIRAKYEGEDTNPETLRLTARQWPDKTLAASALLLMAGTSTINWWTGLLVGALTVEGLSGRAPWLYAGGILVGILGVIAARELYYQRSPWFAIVASLAGLVGIAIFVVGPLLSIAALVLIALGWREREFHEAITP